MILGSDGADALLGIATVRRAAAEFDEELFIRERVEEVLVADRSSDDIAGLVAERRETALCVKRFTPRLALSVWEV